MPIKRYKARTDRDDTARQIEVGIANGKLTPQACKEAEITVQTVLPLAERIRRPEAGSSETTEGTGKRERKAQASGGRVAAGKAGSEEYRGGETSKPWNGVGCAWWSMCGRNMNSPERHACAGWVNQWRGTQRYVPLQRTDEDALTGAILTLASEYGRYGYRRILRRCCGPQVGRWGKIECNASGVAKG